MTMRSSGMCACSARKRAPFISETVRSMRQRAAVYPSTALALGARISRHELHVALSGRGCRGHARRTGPDRRPRRSPTRIRRIDHATPRCKSHQLHKCIADGAAHAVFSGKIIVREGASGTDSAQSSRNLLLSGKAHIDTQPQLEIFNDDVSCKHGATIGQIDAEALFFLKSRGLTEERGQQSAHPCFCAPRSSTRSRCRLAG